jgi:hypothetical protein
VLRAPHACTSLRAACPGAASSRFGLPVCARAHLRPARVRPALASPSARAASLVWPCPGAHVPACGLPTCGLPLFRLPAFACPHLRRAHVRTPFGSPSPRAHVPTCGLPTCGPPPFRPPHVRTSARAPCPRVASVAGGLPTCAPRARWTAHVCMGAGPCEGSSGRANVRPPDRWAANVPTRVQTCALRSLARRTVSLPYSRGGSCAVARFARVRSFAGRACGLRCSRDGLVAVGRFAHLRSFAGCKSGPVTCGVHRTATGALCTPQDRGRSMRRAGVATGALCSPHPPRIAQGAESARPRCARVACAARPRVRFVQTPRPKVLSVSSRGHRFGTLPLNHSAIGPS